MAQPQSEGRKTNDAQPLGERTGLESDRQTDKIGAEEQRTPRAKAIGRTFKTPPADE